MSSGVKKFKLTGNLVERGLTESISGDGTEDVGVTTAATLGSLPTQKITTVVRGSAVVANRNVSLDSIKEMHLDSNNNPIALISNEYNDEMAISAQCPSEFSVLSMSLKAMTALAIALTLATPVGRPIRKMT
ncbi:MAG: hypothetical protein U1F04_08000 [Burkholderiaceae bacterium]